MRSSRRARRSWRCTADQPRLSPHAGVPALEAHVGCANASVLGARPVAYFSAEFGLHESMPIYSGGLGILAGDHLKSASDLGIPLVGIGLYLRPGLFPPAARSRRLAARGLPRRRQPAAADAAGDARTASRVTVDIDTRTGRIVARVWQLSVGRNTLLLLDSNVEGNSPEDRELTARLYGGDHRVRIRQELLLGVGGVQGAGGARHHAWVSCT